MSHVDDGILHAYLDGELSPVERAGVEAHLGACGACRERLAEERGLIERADRLLALAVPPGLGTGAVPALAPRRRRSWFVPGAWAASIAAAFVAGWLLHVERVGPAGPAGPARALLDRDLAASPAIVATSPAPATPPARPDRFAGRPPSPAHQSGPVPSPAAAAPGAPGAPAAPSTLADASARALVTPGVVSNRTRAPSLKTDEPRPAAPAAGSGAAEAGGPPRRDLAFGANGQIGTSWPVITAEPARDRLGAELVTIPGLPVRDIRQDPDDSGRVLVEQELTTGAVVQLLLERADSGVAGVYRPVVGAPLERTMGSLRVRIAGPLSIDSLFRLLESAR